MSTLPGRILGRQSGAVFGLIGGAVCPEAFTHGLQPPQPLFVRHRVLDNEPGHTLRMCNGKPVADGPAIILHIKRITVEMNRLRKLVDDIGDRINV